MQPKINTNENGSYAIEGELNNQTVPDISKQLLTLIPAVEGKNITLDLALVSRSDSAGVALLVEVMQLAKSANLTLLFSNLPQQMKDIAGISGLLDILPISEN
ncbi:MAG: STAS domain-containing protein [Gammaproteobacteria bacterium]|nr:STAS domain-containing protein [Gammaproteobacteria bacterium]